MRNYKRKSTKGMTPLQTLQEGADRVSNGNESCRSVAKDLEICHVTLYRFLKKQSRNSGEIAISRVGYGKNRQVFSDAEEVILTEYIKNASSIYFGLSPREVRKLAFQCAVTYNKSFPENWLKCEMAGSDWFSGFLKRNPTISVRTPEATSISRAIGFNKNVVASFYNKLAEVMDRCKFDYNDIWNMYETGVTTVLKPSKVVAEKGLKQIGAITSGKSSAVSAKGKSSAVSAKGKSSTFSAKGKSSAKVDSSAETVKLKMKKLTPAEVRKAIMEITLQSETEDSDDDDDELTAMLCEDTTDEDDDVNANKSKKVYNAVRRSTEDLTSSNDRCFVCGEFGKGGEWWFRCTVCGNWAHKACTDADRPDSYVCDHCK